MVLFSHSKLTIVTFIKTFLKCSPVHAAYLKKCYKMTLNYIVFLIMRACNFAGILYVLLKLIKLADSLRIIYNMHAIAIVLERQCISIIIT